MDARQPRGGTIAHHRAGNLEAVYRPITTKKGEVRVLEDTRKYAEGEKKKKEEKL